MVKNSVRREVGAQSMPPLTPLPSAASNRSVHAATSTGKQLRSPASESCLTLAGTIDPSFIVCLSMNVTIQPSCLPSLNAVYIARAFRCPFIGHTGRRSCSPFAGWFPAGATISRPYNRFPNNCSTTKALTAAAVTSTTALPAYLATPSRRSASKHVVRPDIALCANTACRTSFGLRHVPAGSSLHPAESSSLHCGPPVRLRLLSTPPRGDAVTFGYEALAYPDTDLHRAVVAPSRAHIGVGKDSRPPLPPNRACGSPAHGSPVGCFHIGTGSPTQGFR